MQSTRLVSVGYPAADCAGLTDASFSNSDRQYLIFVLHLWSLDHSK